jgi:hypothetical protein
MIDAPDLTKLRHAEWDALILALLRELAASEAQIPAYLQDMKIILDFDRFRRFDLAD